MIYDPLIDALAALPLTLLVKAADNQHDPNQTACFCPICKGQSTPHFIIYKNEDGGVYGKPMQRWACTKTKRSGYGAIELMAAILNVSLEASNLKKVCKKLADKAGYESPILESDFKNWDFAEQPQDILTISAVVTHSPEALREQVLVFLVLVLLAVLVNGRKRIGLSTGFTAITTVEHRVTLY